MPHTVVMVGSLDTKSDENEFLRQVLEAAGMTVVLIDTGVLGSAGLNAEIPREEVARAGGRELADLVTDGDRGKALAVMAEGAAAVVTRLHSERSIDGAIALGGTGGTSVAARAFRDLPVGFPKVIVSTAASGNTEAYVGETDLILVPSIVDIAGLNRISTRIIANAAAALVGMVTSDFEQSRTSRPMIAASMFGVTTPCVTHARSLLEELGYEVLVFHMTGSGGRALESLVRQGFFAGVLDVTTTELADHLVGGVFDAGPERVTAAGDTGVPQVVSVGAVDMVNFGAPATVPVPFRGRTLYEHNSSVTLMRTTAEENAAIGAVLAGKLAASRGPTACFIPLRGVSVLDLPGQPFADPDADSALFEAVRSGLSGTAVELTELDLDINDPRFASAMVDRLHTLIGDESTSSPATATPVSTTS